MSGSNQETFFRPAVHESRDWTLPATLYKSWRKPLRDSPNTCVFVPIRSMQFLAVIEEEEIVFVDSMDYMVHSGVGGRVILLAWQFAPVSSLASITEPVPCRVVHYRPQLADVQRRLVGEFTKALDVLEYRCLEAQSPRVPRVLPFGRE